MYTWYVCVCVFGTVWQSFVYSVAYHNLNTDMLLSKQAKVSMNGEKKKSQQQQDKKNMLKRAYHMSKITSPEFILHTVFLPIVHLYNRTNAQNHRTFTQYMDIRSRIWISKATQHFRSV